MWDNQPILCQSESKACKGLGTAANRGRVMQQCSNKTCNATIFHTAVFESYERAVQQAKHYYDFAPCAKAAPVGLVPIGQPFYLLAPGLIPALAAPIPAPVQPPPPPLPLPHPSAVPVLQHPKGLFSCAGFWCLLKKNGKPSIAQWTAPVTVLATQPLDPALNSSIPAASSSTASGNKPDTVHVRPYAVGPMWNAETRAAHEAAAITRQQKVENRLLKMAPHCTIRLFIWHADGKCVGLAEELAMQPVLGKRTQPTEQVVLPVSKGLPFNLIESSAPTVSSQHSPSISVALTSPIIYKPMSHSVSPDCLLPPKSQRNTLPDEHANTEPKGKGKCRVTKKFQAWPTNFYVSEVVAGFDFIRKGRQQGRTTIASLFKEF
ncbi:hypothetical protein JB92DRAFT_2830668 [Gautieria morchelliformis]|nr:hypothetical protein JB92DRAFT_2830668 [Gautieria morchelliformis]